jgi:hypothetical protein
MDEFESLSHSKWECKYHVVFIPKRRRKTLYGELKSKRQTEAVLNQSLICARSALTMSRSKAYGSKPPPHHSSMASCSS